ncbi:hypothetical protein J41TS12_50430 [Paenibacillus antibioticophila]|uniref:Uncharacterized protein n=1 Tax=Paenibacillus antibioticophila TaxID=1274374 RepID=A0A920CKN4_9BACL|nr:hypothetical protein [Paenibacillus antibioticophila]GIO40182.1 hypothetical protein J41TS12_50430 [Paenibacillus antibioticophila]
MDEQTLKYMGERVDKAREIKEKIKDLNHLIDYSADRDKISILDGVGNGPTIDPKKFKALASRARVAILEQVVEEIKRLEQELAEI